MKNDQANTYRIPAAEVIEAYGGDVDEILQDVLLQDAHAPACCSEGCEVEPDGTCPHGCPSLLLALGVI